MTPPSHQTSQSLAVLHHAYGRTRLSPDKAPREFRSSLEAPVFANILPCAYRNRSASLHHRVQNPSNQPWKPSHPWSAETARIPDHSRSCFTKNIIPVNLAGSRCLVLTLEQQSHPLNTFDSPFYCTVPHRTKDPSRSTPCLCYPTRT